MGKIKKYNKIKEIKKLSRELIPLKATSVIKEKKRDLIEEAIRLAEEEEWGEWKKELKQS